MSGRWPAFTAKHAVSYREQVMKRAVAILITAAGLMVATPIDMQEAQAAKRYYWTEQKSETRLKQKYTIIRKVSCLGSGYNAKFRKGQWVYSQFICSGKMWSGKRF